LAYGDGVVAAGMKSHVGIVLQVRRLGRPFVVGGLAIGIGVFLGVGVLSGPSPTRNTGTLTAAKSSPPKERTIMLYGDSLAVQAARYFVITADRSPDVVAKASTWDGTAPCDWLPTMLTAAKSRDISVAVLAFSGDSETPCMKGAPYGSARYYQRYSRDVTRAAAAFARNGTKVILIGAPQSHKQFVDGDIQWNRLNRILASIAKSRPQDLSYDDAGGAVMANGHFTWSMPCWSIEPCLNEPVAGENVVRAPDGFHFCPNGTDPCTTYMSGAVRYGVDMAEHALIQLSTRTL
jgi:hypothetical protein